VSVAIAERQASFCATFVDELAARGVRHVVICPGSRSTPLALAAVEVLEVHVRLDERSAGFFAQGLARASGQPVLVVVTSGTAAAELSPAVAEARFDTVPLIVATADRPPELVGVGAPQTIFQRGIFGDHPRLELDPGLVHELEEERWRPLAAAAVDAARGVAGGGVPGPVHVNLPFAEPLLGRPGPLSARILFEAPAPPAPPELDAFPLGSTLVVAGAGLGVPERLVAATEALGWPVLADARSGLRGTGRVVCAFDAILRADEQLALRPDVVVLAGAPPASKVMAGTLEAWHDAGSRLVVLGPQGLERHPSRLPALVLAAEPSATLGRLAERLDPASPELAERWRRAEELAEASIEEQLAGGPLSEPRVARAVARAASASGAALVSSSSMPIRDLEWFGGDACPTVIANRGANGIDGVVSTAMGVAAAGRSTACVVGDLAFLHDVSALVDAPQAPCSLCVVVVDNAGGGIFSFLPQHDELEVSRFEQLFGTPPKVSPARVARGFGVEVLEAKSPEELDEALARGLGAPGTTVVVVAVPDREANVGVHAELNRRVAEALAPLLAP
jgi:2-succinyl-5-enolpyruvyl-6-hydroxy-3-cyclohexene-1-carboxylate synthase